MEKRAFLAILLSIVILTLYQSIFLKSQHIVKKEVASIKTTQPQKAPLSLVKEAVSLQKPEPDMAIEYYPVSTDKFKLTLSNLGGNITEIYLKDYDTVILGSQFLAIEEFNHLPFSFTSQPHKIFLSYADQEVKIEKIFNLTAQNYLIEYELVITNLTNKDKNYNLYLNNAVLDLSKLASSPDSRNNLQFLELAISLPDKILRNNIGRFNSQKAVYNPAEVQWLGIRDRYFCTILKPKEPTKGYFVKPVDKKQVITGLWVDCSVLANSSSAIKADFYAGPQEINLLKSHNLGWESIVNFGFFSPISQFILRVLKFVHKFIPNWGLCIVILSILISLILYPFTFKSLKSMREMQMLQPEIERLRQAYKDQPQKLNREILELYRKHKVNPFGGCLPLFLQLPIFVSLYQALMRSIELRGARFLWIRDLSQPDRLFILPKPLPVIANEINLLPILMAVTMFIQQKMSAKGGSAVSSEQQKLMLILMPILFGFIFYHFPSGLALYWTCYTIISVISQWKLSSVKKG